IVPVWLQKNSEFVTRNWQEVNMFRLNRISLDPVGVNPCVCPAVAAGIHCYMETFCCAENIC
ncbi:MAG: hypothetical protein II615_00050, partial [Ruminococcus sp.]|nr:hypothetical protein [Ruminococcus sp.]